MKKLAVSILFLVCSYAQADYSQSPFIILYTSNQVQGANTYNKWTVFNGSVTMQDLTVNGTCTGCGAGGGGGGGSGVSIFDRTQTVSVSTFSIPGFGPVVFGVGSASFSVVDSTPDWTGSHKFKSSSITVTGAGVTKLNLLADTDNSGESDVPGVYMSMDGVVTTGNLEMDSNNNLILGANSTTAPNLYFATRSDGTSFTSASDAKMTILNAGNVGIGTVGPSSKLDVFNGSITARGTNAGVAIGNSSLGARSIGVGFSGNGSVISVSSSGSFTANFNATITSFTIVSPNEAGQIRVDVSKASFGQLPTYTSICGGSCPSLSGTQKNASSSLGAWTTAVGYGDQFRFSVDTAPATITEVIVTVHMEIN